MKATLTAALICAATIAASQTTTQQTRMSDAPCKEVVAILDSNPSSDMGLEPMMAVLGDQAVQWGVLLGIELLHPDVRGTHETFLTRLRIDCASSPNTPAMELINGYIAE